VLDVSSVHILVRISAQTLDLLDDHGCLTRSYRISTSRFGPGTEPGSHKTPLGRFRVAEKHGHGQPLGMIFVSRVATGRYGAECDEHDHVQTRILWLEGLDAENANTFSRYIYIHGTNAESRLGAPASFGCVRMANADVVDLFERVPVGTGVEICA
jgi:lipoprotein-anchoring transpeptidase ErfK/SrfK